MGLFGSPYRISLPSISVSVEIDSTTVGSSIPTYFLLINPVLIFALFYLAGRNLDFTKTRLGLLIIENTFGVVIGFTISVIVTIPGIALHLIPLLILFSFLLILRLSLNLFFIEFTALTIVFIRTFYDKESFQVNRNQFQKLLFMIALLSCAILGFYGSYGLVFWMIGLGPFELGLLVFAFAMIAFLLEPVLIFMIFHRIGKKINHKMDFTSLALSLIIGNFIGYFIGYIIPLLVASLEITSMLILLIPRYYYPVSLIFIQLTALYLPLIKRMRRIHHEDIETLP